jgi:mycothiol system anti-sigma-R factor
MNTGCEHAIEYVYHYLDHELTFTRSTRIRWHLRRCNGCCDAFDFETRLKSVIRERGRDEPPPELFDRLRALIHEEAARGDVP